MLQHGWIAHGLARLVMWRRSMPSYLVVVLLLSACASTRAVRGGEHASAPRARVTLSPIADEDTVRLLPQAIEPMLPSADRLSRVITARLGPRATVDVHYCVSPAGTIVSAELSRRSAFAAFDQAVMTDIVGWKFLAQPDARTCQAATIVYRPAA